MSILSDKHKEIIGNKFSELDEPSQELNLYIYELLTKNGIVVTEELAKSYITKILTVIKDAFNKGMEAQRLLDESIIKDINMGVSIKDIFNIK